MGEVVMVATAVLVVLLWTAMVFAIRMFRDDPEWAKSLVKRAAGRLFRATG